MKPFIMASVAALVFLFTPHTTHTSAPVQSQEEFVQVAVTCFFQGEQTSGFNKICYYDCLGSMTAINVSSVSLCPLTIAR